MALANTSIFSGEAPSVVGSSRRTRVVLSRCSGQSTVPGTGVSAAIKIGAKAVSHGRCVSFQMAEVAVSRQMLQDILSLIARLPAPPAPA
jgi:hypothetical protein